MLASHETEQHLISQLLATLQALPNADVRKIEHETAEILDRRFAAEIEIRIDSKTLMLQVEAKKTAYPRDVQQFLWQVRPRTSDSAALRGAAPLLAAESLSPGAKDLLRAEQVGYFDSGGSLYLSAPGVYVYIDKPPPKTHISAMRSLFTGRRAQVIHALLIRPSQWFGVKALAECSLVSPATASEVLTELEKFDWVATRGQGPNKERTLQDRRALLDAWAAAVMAGRPPALRRYFIPGTKPDALIDRVAKAFEAHGAGYAISHEAAAQHYAPFLTSIGQVRCRAIESPTVNEALADLDARVVSEGANFSIIDVKTEGDLLFRERIGDVWLASPVHVYLDLLKGEGRAKEMADHLRRERIGC